MKYHFEQYLRASGVAEGSDNGYLLYCLNKDAEDILDKCGKRFYPRYICST